jgi:hypothetical protein
MLVYPNYHPLLCEYYKICAKSGSFLLAMARLKIVTKCLIRGSHCYPCFMDI